MLPRYARYTGERSYHYHRCYRRYRKGNVMTYLYAHDVFRAAMQQRKAKYPFDRISAYKVRECRDNLNHELRVVETIADYIQTHPSDRRGTTLVGCVEGDKSIRLKRIPNNIARELGYNLIPAIEALTLEGVPAANIVEFIQSIKPQVDRLLADCDAVQLSTARSIKHEYDAMKAGRSNMKRICAEALRIAKQAVAFCNRHGVS